MKYVFAGGMTISVEILEVLCSAGFKPEHAFGYPPSLSHRSNYSPIDGIAEKHGFPFTNTDEINSSGIEKILKQYEPDWFLVFGWSQLIKEHLLRIPRYGTLGFHMTKLPEGRGRAPVAWTLIKGKEEGGVTLLWLEPGADNGPIAAQRTYPVSLYDDAEVTVEKVNRLACEIIREVLPDLCKGTLPRISQDESKASHWEKRTPKDGLINWELPVGELFNFIRGITRPFPGAFSFLGGKRVIVWKAGLVEVEHSLTPGTVIGPYCAPGKNPECGMPVAGNGGFLILREIEIEGEGSLTEEEMLRLAGNWKGQTFRPGRR
jgi:methionyl-tRNA formyltransferase